jgi:hypothetical protein
LKCGAQVAVVVLVFVAPRQLTEMVDLLVVAVF